jgi:hypothetical protein
MTPDADEDNDDCGSMHISQNSAMRAAYMTRMAKLEYEERANKLVDVEAVRF